ncbi:MAG: glutamine-hydrolyzing carbamoyl-phosphate synthase small subunit [Gammaproteobacteria bacterium]|nr:glutamine-hydrolyzing carbamoyl-phosphate synthase small subunit [Gammaproteobacteria bacterium]
MTKSAFLLLEDDTLLEGRSIGHAGCSVGEVVFNTAMTGYQEIVSDPSYARQIVTLTCPHIGNTGVNDEDDEAARIHAAGLVVRDVPACASNWRSRDDLGAWLSRHRITAAADMDTRRLTRHLRRFGAMNGVLFDESVGRERAAAALGEFAGLKGMDLASEVTTDKTYRWRQGAWRADGGYADAGEARWSVVAYDYGIKRNILRMLSDHNCRVEVVPATTPAREVIERRPDGVFLSNGPGDPEPCDYAIEAIRELLDANLPVFGICLGHQLLGLACGARTQKMKFGHHGANHPVLEIDSGRVLITSQNHGFCVEEASLPGHLRATHRSLFDGSLQGIRHTEKPAFGFQGHPEASPGPHDVSGLFGQFAALMQQEMKQGMQQGTQQARR